MRSTTYLVMTLLFLSSLLISCGGNDYQEISKEQLLSEIAPSGAIKNLELKNNKHLFVYTDAEIPFRVAVNSSTDAFQLNRIINSMGDHPVDMSYINNSGGTGFKDTLPGILPLMPFIGLMVFILHFILVYISLRRILGQPTEGNEQLVHTIIVTFIPFIGPLAYLTRVKHKND
ncbi:hypothetical protein [Robertkochia sediminum]|uniref:hypothetical protein n=1 Tax=Robertkochia sediminum TaxID=2785326 RepID=UPI001931C808|nr:hypothetical protein [Robertkochia sediminum]MBL7472575.1 hypothetical protein [Robertkochia sediminum]